MIAFSWKENTMTQTNNATVATPVSLSSMTDAQLCELHDRLGEGGMNALIKADEVRQARQDAAAKQAETKAALRAKGAASIKATMAAIEARQQAEHHAAAVEAAREVSKIVEDLTACLEDGDRVGADKAIKALQEEELYYGVVEYFGSKKAWNNFLELRRHELRELFRRPLPRRRWHK